MGLDIWFSEGIRNALLAANEGCSSTAGVCSEAGADPEILQAYLKGYRAALVTLALAFGMSPAIIVGYHQEALVAGEESGGAEAEEDGDVVHLVPDRIWQ